MSVPKHKTSKVVTLLDYGAGNVRSVRNAITKLGYTTRDVTCPDDIRNADSLVFPGVGSFASCMQRLQEEKYEAPLREYIVSGKPFFGICLGMQMLFESSAEGECKGLGIIPGKVGKFDTDMADMRGLSVPHIGWNEIRRVNESGIVDEELADERYYFVHSFRALPSEANQDWLLTVTDYGERFISAVQKGAVVATQFHPEKSAGAGLSLLKRFLEGTHACGGKAVSKADVKALPQTKLSKRIIACLDVRTNDKGDLVVTKGDQYDVREKGGAQDVINLGMPVQLATNYYDDGADEVAFLNITSFRSCPLTDAPMLRVLEAASENVFVPLTIGGGIRSFTDDNGKTWEAIEVAGQYFRSGADKVSIGSDAVMEAEKYYASERKLTGKSSIEQISHHYGAQAVVVSLDPRKVYVSDPSLVSHHTIQTKVKGPNGEEYCWYQATIKGGREGRDISAFAVAQACEAMGTGEILLNCIDKDGTKSGFDLELINDIRAAVTIPVIASSGAGNVGHFVELFNFTDVEAGLAAGIFHRKEVPLQAVKTHLRENGIPVRC